ncbi:PEPxxWA-CTERM sorting domain-containing protein [Pelomonas sp. KK5]|uniref:PEPxxWA-CTERM sorting domain-containing protein n=1 Tax=Pelomonas sp. KK5 TaxID=1855730 RepID=UPI00097C8E80|nr:PEPxxWA-CTERM sorting domain-containing protein [Pelomonas sp. KK5]
MDSYHASAWGSYLEALTDFGQVTGLDPRSLGAGETAATALGISGTQAVALQSLAYEQLQISAAVPEPQSWALMLGGLAVLGRLARRRSTS